MQRCPAVLVGLVDGRPLSHQQFQTGLALQKDNEKDGRLTFFIFSVQVHHAKADSLFQFIGSGFRIRIDFGQLGTDPHWECGLGSMRAKITQKNRRKVKFQVLKCWTFSY
jgi:hypothetical protein